MLLNRHAEQAALGRLLVAARAGQSGVLVVRGAPGIGKTALLENAVESAPEFRVARTVACRLRSVRRWRPRSVSAAGWRRIVF